MRRFLMATALVGFSLSGACVKEVGRIPFNGPGESEATLTLDASKEVDFWVELDVEFEGSMELGYVIYMFQGGKKIGKARCAAFNPSTKLMSVETSVGDEHKRKYEGKMRCSQQIASSGPTVLKVRAVATPPPRVLRKFNLVVKQ